MIITTRYELELEIKSREKIIQQCNDLITKNEALIKDKWNEIKDFVSGNSAEKAQAGGEFIVARKAEIRKSHTEIRRKEDQIANLKAKLKFKDDY